MPTLTGGYNKVKEGDEISIKAYDKIFPPEEDENLGPKYTIMIINRTGKTTNSFSESTYHNEHIGNLKERIAKNIEIPSSEFTLWWRDVLLDDNKTPKDYEMGNASRIYIRLTNPQASKPTTEAPVQAQTENEANMDWVTTGNTITLIFREGGIGEQFDIPLTLTPRTILRRYATYKRNSMYETTYALYNDSYKLPMDEQIGDLAHDQFIREGDTLDLAPDKPLAI